MFDISTFDCVGTVFALIPVVVAFFMLFLLLPYIFSAGVENHGVDCDGCGGGNVHPSGGGSD